VGVEFAYFYNAIGCKVTLIEMMPSALPGEDGEISRLLERLLKRQGVDIVTSTSVQAVDVTDDGVKVSVRAAEPGKGGVPGSGVGGADPAGAAGVGGRAGRRGGPGVNASGRGAGTGSSGAGKPGQESGAAAASGGGDMSGRSGASPGGTGREASPSSPTAEGESERSFEASLALMAVGVIPNTADLGLEEAGVELGKGGFIKVDEYMTTTVEGIYAIGDVAGPPLLAHVASGQGIIAVEKIAGESPGPFRAELMPRCVYCQPQVASVGLTEDQAKERGHEVTVGRFPFRASGKSVAVGERDGMVKVVADAKTGRLLGAAIIGSEATELISEPTLAQSLDDGCRKLLSTVHAHPTLSEAVMEAAGDAFGMAIHKPADPLGGGKR
jgi:pyruvate/2-oxoglutarate dehydrogenase complex dihydrolipoamide dehydrogenase (E3) component